MLARPWETPLLSEPGKADRQRAIKTARNMSALQSSDTEEIIFFESGSGARAAERQG